MLIMSSETRINVRTTPAIKRDLEIAAKLKGMTVSALINSLAVKTIREEKEYDPSAFAAKPRGQVVAHIEPAKDELRRKFEEEVETVGTRKVPVLKKKVR